MKKLTLTSVVIITSAILFPSSVRATDLSTAINYFLKIDPNFLNNLASSTISKTFPGLTGTFNLGNLISPNNLTALNPTQDYAKVLQSIIDKNPSISPSTANLQLTSSLNKAVVTAQANTGASLNSEASKVVETTGSIFSENKNLSPESSLEATTAVIKGQSATGESFKVIIAQNTHLSSQLQVSNELAVKAKDTEISRDQENDRLRSQAIDLKFSNSNPAFNPK
jgi:hypothetical protein